MLMNITLASSIVKKWTVHHGKREPPDMSRR
jgi:hypothetical protein